MEISTPPQTQTSSSTQTQGTSNQNQNDSKLFPPISTKVPEFSLEKYLSGYEGHTRLFRLIFIAERTRNPPNDALSAAAYQMALDEVKQTLNVSLHVDISKTIGKPVDKAWVEASEKKFSFQAEKLHADLDVSKTNISKDVTRNSYIELGKLHSDRGDFESALKCFSRGRDYCTTKNLAAVCLHFIRTCIIMGNYNHVFGYINKAETLIAKNEPSMNELKIAIALGHLEQRRYKLCAENLFGTFI
eukprot:TRINITY_DN6389_c0_g1_i1.p1 TRINITY_DN6389_c0_g1~~TRINITY_DN6389_c0_g1_i1.p1  ORF type:complete len:255 (-),score=85.64 TRINITY_DN6389_c0_g1_i1:702-1436(-)